jgi:acetyl-CoA synthetase (ADP-forming)
VSEIIDKARKEKRRNLMEPEAKTICREYGIPITEFKVAFEKADAVFFAQELGFPVVLKIVSPDVIHKSDIGGVAVNVRSAEEVRETYTAILGNVRRHRPKARITGILVQEMAPPSTEVIVGALKDSQFGPSVMFGLGGVFVEVLKDVVFRIAPVTMQEAKLMISQIKACKVLQGFRNAPPADTHAIAEIIVKTSRLAVEHEEIRELDLNPVIVYQKGAKTVDARIILESES